MRPVAQAQTSAGQDDRAGTTGGDPVWTPQNLEAERAVLGALMLTGGPNAGSRLVAKLRAEGLTAVHFYLPSHGRIYAACEALLERGVGCDTIAVENELRRRGQIGETTGQAALVELYLLATATGNAPHHARLVVEAALRRDQLRAAIQLQAAAANGDGSIDSSLRDCLRSVLDTRASGQPLIGVERWRDFAAAAEDDLPCLVEGLWPEGALGFIGAPSKAGKTWLALDLALSVATGRPFLGRFAVRRPRPVLFLALEGHRSAVKARIGCLARGRGIDPDSDALDRLLLAYRPRGIDLMDPLWADALAEAVQSELDGLPEPVALVMIDVLRAAAPRAEADAAGFAVLRSRLAPRLLDAGVSAGITHHFGKYTDAHAQRSPAERMSGTGAMRGAMDVGLFITSSEQGARKLSVEVELRDLAGIDPFDVRLSGDGSGSNGSLTYADTATLMASDGAPVKSPGKAPAAAIAKFIREHGGTAGPKEIRDRFDIADKTLAKQRPALEKLGVRYVNAGPKSRYELADHAMRLPAIREPGHPDYAGVDESGAAKPHDYAESTPDPGHPGIDYSGLEETLGLQGSSQPGHPALLRSDPAGSGIGLTRAPDDVHGSPIREPGHDLAATRLRGTEVAVRESTEAMLCSARADAAAALPARAAKSP